VVSMASIGCAGSDGAGGGARLAGVGGPELGFWVPMAKSELRRGRPCNG
jgi:hypothetical protein